MNEVVMADAVKNGGNSMEMQEMLRLSVMLYYQPELLDEYQRLRKLHIRTQKESSVKILEKDPLAEFELLFKKWERCQHKIK